MTAEEIEAFFENQEKQLPALPVWRDHKSRDGEVKARIPVEVSGVISDVELEITLKHSDPKYMVIVLIAPACLARLCIGKGHRNRITGETTSLPHFHHWSANKHLTKREAMTLPFCVELPGDVVGRDAAFAWFLKEVGIESPPWLPVKWPEQGVFI